MSTAFDRSSTARHNYVANILPFETLRVWLTRDGSEMERTELALIGEHGQYHERHGHIASPGVLRDTMKRNRLVRIDVGSQKDSQGNVVRRRVVFDLDAKDYQPFLPAKGDAEEMQSPQDAIRSSVWYVIALSVRILDLYLQFCAPGMAGDGAQSYRSCTVFSGRRGAHLWLHNCYRDAYNAAAIARLCDVMIPSLNTAAGALALFRTLKAREELRGFFSILSHYGQVCLTGPVIWERNHDEVRTILMPAIEALARECGIPEPEEPGSTYFIQLLKFLNDDADFWTVAGIILAAPRLDRNVTTASDHMLKAPFSVHHRNGNIAIPIDLKHVESPDWNINHVCLSPQDAGLRDRIRQAVELFEGSM